MKTMRIVNMIAILLLIIGGINWGLVGLMGLDLVAVIFGAGTLLANLVYILVGVSAVYSIYLLRGYFKP